MRSEASALEARREGLIRELADLEEKRLRAREDEEQRSDVRASLNALRHEHAQIDPFDTAGIARKNRRDRMLMVLLDEMNLARVGNRMPLRNRTST